MERRDFLRLTGYGVAAIPLQRHGGTAGAPHWRFPATLRDDVEAWSDLASTPGVVIVLLRNGELTQLAVGKAHAGAPEPVTIDTVFEGGSLGKPLFAFGVLRLADAGKLDLDKPLTQYTPLNITPRHVLSHTSGLPNWRDSAAEPLKTMFDPGSRFSYSGEGYFLLQRVVEDVTGSSVQHFAQKWIFGPLGMKDSGYLWHPDIVPRLAGGHGERGKEQPTWNRHVGRELWEAAQKEGVDLDSRRTGEMTEAFKKVEPKEEPAPNFLLPNVAGSLFTTPADYARFVGHLAHGSSPLLSPALMKSMLRPQITVKRDISWGLGWGLEEHAGRTIAWHWGDNYYFQNFVMWIPGTGDAVLVFTNGASGKKVYSRVVREITGVDYEAFVWI